MEAGVGEVVACELAVVVLAAAADAPILQRAEVIVADGKGIFSPRTIRAPRIGVTIAIAVTSRTSTAWSLSDAEVARRKGGG
jgi:hypothetical protein